MSGIRARFMLVPFAVAVAAAAPPIADLTPAQRISRRGFPSVFQAWNEAQTPPDRPGDERLCMHDLLFTGVESTGLEWDHRHAGLAAGFTHASVARARQRRAGWIERNPNLVVLTELRYRDAHESYLPADHPWWKRDADGGRIVGWAEGGYFLLDFENVEYQRHLARQARAMIDSGVADGIMLDWWKESDARIELLKSLREAIGPDALILVNANDEPTPRSAEFVNGLYMECFRSATPADWRRIEQTLRWAETNLRSARVNCLEIWHGGSRHDLAKMRAATTLALTASDGFCLFADPNELPTPDHLHDWYAFWDTPLGRPIGPGRTRDDGAVDRRFTGGVAIYNPPGNEPVTVVFDASRRSVTTGESAHRHRVNGGDGDLFTPIDGDAAP